MHYETPYPLMYDIHINKPGILKRLLKQDSTKASGPDELKPRLLKEQANEITPTIV